MGGEELLIYGLTMTSAGCAALTSYPTVSRWLAGLAWHVERYHQRRLSHATKALDDMFVEVKPTWLTIAYGVGPIVAGLGLYLLTNHLLLTALGACAGFVLPDLWVRSQRVLRQRKFRAQMVDAIFIISSSLRAGLSLTQALEALESEMPPPVSQEFGLMLKAHRLGRTLDEAFQGLQSRMNCEELTLLTTAILVSRGSGGDVMKMLDQLVMTIRERKKLAEKVATLTLQGRLQAYVMSLLPLAFAAFTRTFNARYFEVFLNEPIGRTLLVVTVGLWIVGMVLLFRLSRVDI